MLNNLKHELLKADNQVSEIITDLKNAHKMFLRNANSLNSVDGEYVDELIKSALHKLGCHFIND